jgi:beta-glucosidase
LKLDRAKVASDGTVTVSATIKNVGALPGDEVAQLYLHPLAPKRSRASKELRGIERISLKPGESRVVTFTIRPDRDLTFYDENKKAYAVDPGAYEVQVGASSADIRQRTKLTVM